MFHKDQRAYNTQIRATMVNGTERDVFDTCTPSYNRIMCSIISSNSRLSSKELRWTMTRFICPCLPSLEEITGVDHFARNCIVRHFHRVAYIYISSGNFFFFFWGRKKEGKGIRISSSEANVRGGLSWLSGINRTRGEYSVLNFEGGIKNRYVDRILNEGRELRPKLRPRD